MYDRLARVVRKTENVRAVLVPDLRRRWPERLEARLARQGSAGEGDSDSYQAGGKEG
jgi:hypothetical protein